MADTNNGDESTTSSIGRDTGWERKTLEKLAFAALDEQRRARRWRIIRFFLIGGFFFLVLFGQYLIGRTAGVTAEKYTALVDMDGVIAQEETANADNVVAGLRAAFEDTSVVGVILRVNSPGGSPVQSRYIYDEIRRLRKEYPNTPLYAVISDMCASGCYYVVAAADKIYASEGSIVGSIGVLMNGFGFTEAMKKLGIERRLYTAGEHKGFLDPFGPIRAYERQHVQQLLDRIHKQFIKAVRDGRGKSLKETKDTFSGLFWTGDQARTMGLVDEFGSASFVAREVLEAEEIVDFTFRENVLDRFARNFGSAMGSSLGLRLTGPSIQ
jgi:protease-4